MIKEIFKDNEFRIAATKINKLDSFLIFTKDKNEFNEEYWKKIQTVTENSTLYYLLNNLLERRLGK